MQITRKSYIFLLSGLVIIILAVYLIILPLAGSITSLSKDVYDQKITLEMLKKRSENVANLMTDYSQLKAYEQLLNKFFINKNDQLNFLTSLENTATKNKLTQELVLQEIGQINKIKEAPLEIVLTGSFTDIVKYLSEIESMDYYLVIDSIDFSKSGNLSGGLTATIESKTYWQEL